MAAEGGDDEAGIGAVQRVLGFADDPALAAPAVPRAIAEVAEDARPESPSETDYDDEKARGQAYQAGVLMIGGILIAGVGLLALVMIWGNRMRRIARQPLPPVAPRDELWFLRNKKPGPQATAGEPPAADEARE